MKERQTKMAENLRIASEKPAETQTQQAGQQQVRLHMDERNMKTSYANFFRTNGSADELTIDFCMSAPMAPAAPEPGKPATPEFMVQVNDRVVMNYYNAKGLALRLGQLIRMHEEQFGELELDPSKRAKKK
jgi:hypothetical protein